MITAMIRRENFQKVDRYLPKVNTIKSGNGYSIALLIVHIINRFEYQHTRPTDCTGICDCMDAIMRHKEEGEDYT